MARESIKARLERARTLPTGYDGYNVPEDFSIPSVGLEDVDRAVFNLFDRDVQYEVVRNENGASNVIRVPVIFATGERFALLKRLKPIKDKNGMLILPLISIRRVKIEQENARSVVGGLMADTGDQTVKVRLSKNDQRYQSVINKLSLLNQRNVPGRSTPDSGEGEVASRRWGGPGPARDVTLEPRLGNNVFEIITTPFPHFFTVGYEVTFWTQYMGDMNVMLERLFSSYDAQEHGYKLQTDKGYWFVAYIDETLTPGDNFDDFADEERIVRYTFGLSVPAYLLATKNPGDMVPFRRYISAPTITFEFVESPIPDRTLIETPPYSHDIDDFVLTDVERLEISGREELPRHGTGNEARELIQDPFAPGQHRSRYLRIIDRNPKKGETVINAAFEVSLENLIE